MYGVGRSSDCHSFFSTLEVERRPRGASKTQEKNCFGCKTEDFCIPDKKISPHCSELKKKYQAQITNEVKKKPA
jgi:hypothetical protein